MQFPAEVLGLYLAVALALGMALRCVNFNSGKWAPRCGVHIFRLFLEI